MFSRTASVALASLAAAALCSCSVKEDRVPCPCFITLDFSAVDREGFISEGFETLTWDMFPEAGPEEGSSGLLGIADLPSEMYLEVIKGEAVLDVVCCENDRYLPGHGIQIPYGEDCPSLFVHSRLLDATVMQLRDTVVLHKLSAGLKIRLNNLSGLGVSFALTGNVSGYDESWMPTYGDFYRKLVPDGNGECTAAIPRQFDESLKLCVYDDEGLVQAFALGQYIAESGYDWYAPDLEDIILEIDYNRTGVSITVNQWRKTLSFVIML